MLHELVINASRKTNGRCHARFWSILFKNVQLLFYCRTEQKQINIRNVACFQYFWPWLGWIICTFKRGEQNSNDRGIKWKSIYRLKWNITKSYRTFFPSVIHRVTKFIILLFYQNNSKADNGWQWQTMALLKLKRTICYRHYSVADCLLLPHNESWE